MRVSLEETSSCLEGPLASRIPSQHGEAAPQVHRPGPAPRRAVLKGGGRRVAGSRRSGTAGLGWFLGCTKARSMAGGRGVV